MPIRFRILLVTVAAVVAAYAVVNFYPRWQLHTAAPESAPTSSPSPSANDAEETEATAEPSSPPGAERALPPLDESDDAITQALASLSPDQSFENLFNLQGAVRRF